MQPSASPIIVELLDAPVRGLGLGEVILNAIGLTGALAVAAVVLGLLLAGVVIGYRKVQSRRKTDKEAAQTQPLGLS